jgi:hypothetical protein
MPAILLWVAGALGGAVLAVVLAREARRVNAELAAEEARQRATREPPPRGSIPTLRRDPRTGEYRPD